MKLNIATLFLSVFSVFSSNAQEKANAANQSFYDFNAKSIDGKQINMSLYKGKVVLIVNTASKCGFTPQYDLSLIHI